MSKLNLAKMFNDIKSTVSAHSPELLTGIGIAGMITTTILAVRATPKALTLIDNKKNELELAEEDNLTPVETLKATWKCYVPAAVTGAVSVACIIGASSVNARRNAALATAYNLSATALSEYKDKVVETIGEKKEREIRDKVAEEQVQKNPVNSSAIVVTNKGNTRFLDPITKRRFMSDIELINQIINKLNRQMISGDDFISLNDFYYEVGLEPCDIGDDLGWNVTHGLIELCDPPHAIVDTDGVPCIVLEYEVAPRRGFNRYA